MGGATAAERRCYAVVKRGERCVVWCDAGVGAGTGAIDGAYFSSPGRFASGGGAEGFGVRRRYRGPAAAPSALGAGLGCWARARGRHPSPRSGPRPPYCLAPSYRRVKARPAVSAASTLPVARL